MKVNEQAENLDPRAPARVRVLRAELLQVTDALEGATHLTVFEREQVVAHARQVLRRTETRP